MAILDISEWQPPSRINYDAMSKDLELVIVRVQYGSNYVDKFYKTHIAEFKKRGVPVGVYAWVRGVNNADMEAEAVDFFNRAKEFSPHFYALDVEERSMADMRGGCNAFINKLRALGAPKVGMYVAHHLYASFNLDVGKADFIWIPDYGSNNGQVNNTPQYPCDIHQFTSEGRLNGYTGALDLNRLLGSKTLAWYTGGATTKPPVTTPPTNPVQPSVPQGALPVGKQVVVKKTATNWRDGEAIASFVKGGTYTIMEAQSYNKSFSKFAYLIGQGGVATGWILEQDLVESGIQNGFESAPVGTPGIVHTVVSGDNLWDISRKYGVSMDSIIANNPALRANPDLLSVGQKLTIKGGSGAPTSSAPVYYTVQSGDNLGAIALKYGTTVQAIQRINTDVPNPNLIYAGQVLRVK